MELDIDRSADHAIHESLPDIIHEITPSNFTPNLAPVAEMSDIEKDVLSQIYKMDTSKSDRLTASTPPVNAMFVTKITKMFKSLLGAKNC